MIRIDVSIQEFAQKECAVAGGTAARIVGAVGDHDGTCRGRERSIDGLAQIEAPHRSVGRDFDEAIGQFLCHGIDTRIIRVLRHHQERGSRF